MDWFQPTIHIVTAEFSYNAFILLQNTHNIHPICYNDVARASCRLKSPTSRLFGQELVETSKREDVKVPYYWYFVRGNQWCLVDSTHKMPMMPARADVTMHIDTILNGYNTSICSKIYTTDNSHLARDVLYIQKWYSRVSCDVSFVSSQILLLCYMQYGKNYTKYTWCVIVSWPNP